MAALLSILGVVFGLAGLICGIIILIGAFKDEVIQGILCLCVPFYIIYFALARFEHDNKGVIVGIWLVSVVVNIGLQLAAASAAGGQF